MHLLNNKDDYYDLNFPLIRDNIEVMVHLW